MPRPQKIVHFTVTALVVALVGTALCREVIVITNTVPDAETQISADAPSSQSADDPATPSTVPPAH